MLRGSRNVVFTLILGSLIWSPPVLAQTCGNAVFGGGFEYGDVTDWSVQVGGAAVGATPTVFRIDTLALRDPHVFLDLSIFGCLDGTDNIPLPGAESINTTIDASLNEDSDGDGCLDTTSLLAFRPLVSASTGGETVDFRSGQCSSATACGPGNTGVGSRTAYDTQSTGLCSEPVAGTTSGYSPAVVSPAAPCFGSDIGTADLAFLGDVPLNPQDVRIAATFSGGEPATGLVDGLLYGFLPENEADLFLLPADLPLVGGQPLSSLFPGGTGNCSGADDRDIHNGSVGWWIYLDFSASAVAWSYL